jgi:dynactin complex subunit
VNGSFSILISIALKLPFSEGNFGGILRYFGPVEGQQGIFCGVELDQPVGKNDGIHKGVQNIGE